MKQLLLTALCGCFSLLLSAQTITVAKDGSGDYTTVQAALDAVPLNNTQPVQIYIRKGVYKEKLRLDSTKDFVTLTGEDERNTILTYDDHAGMRNAAGDSITTYSSPSCAFFANDFRAEHLTFAKYCRYLCRSGGGAAGKRRPRRICGIAVCWASRIRCWQALPLVASITVNALLKGVPTSFSVMRCLVL